MASSRSLKKGQIPINCQLCEIERTIVCKCVECNLLLCRSCIKQHSKFKNAQYHKLLDIKDIGSHRGEIDFQCIPCEIHPEQMCCLFCKSCDTLTCPQCVAKVHKKHDLIEIMEAYITKQDSLKSGKSQVEEDIKQIDSKEAQLETLSTNEKANIEKIKEFVKTHMDRVKKSVEDLGTKILDELNQTGNKLNATVYQDRKDLTKAKEVLNQKLIGAEDLLQTMDASRFFKHAKSMTANLKQTDLPKTNSTYQSAVEFVPQKLANIGEIRFSDVTPCTQKTIDSSVIDTYTTDLSRIDCLLAGKNDKVWISSYNDSKLYHAQIKDKRFDVMEKRNIEVCCMARLSQNKVLLSVGEHRLKVLDTYTNDVTDSVLNINPFQSLGVHVTKDCKVIIGAWTDKRKAVIVFDDKGKKDAVYEHDQYRQPIFTYPRKLTSTCNGLIHVVDFYYSENDKGGTVIVLDRNGDIINRYTGNTEINKKFPFRPSDIGMSQTDHVVVADMDSDALHILDNTGELLTFLDTRLKGIMYLHSLAFIDNEHLLIGCSRPIGSSSKDAKIHKLKVCGL